MIELYNINDSFSHFQKKRRYQSQSTNFFKCFNNSTKNLIILHKFILHAKTPSTSTVPTSSSWGIASMMHNIRDYLPEKCIWEYFD